MKLNSNYILLEFRALPDIMSGLEVQKIYKIRTVWKPDVFLPGRWTFKTFKNHKKNLTKIVIVIFFFKNFQFDELQRNSVTWYVKYSKI